MTNLLHLVDPRLRAADTATLRLLLDRLPDSEFRHTLATFDRTAARTLANRFDRPVCVVRPPGGVSLLLPIEVARFARRCGAELVHAWGGAALRAATIAARSRSLIYSGLDLTALDADCRLLRQLRPAPTVVVAGQAMRRALLERGIPPDRAVVVRGATDLGAISRARQAGIREQIAPNGEFVLLTSGPATPAGGEFGVVWLSRMLAQLYPGFRLVLPFESPETDRLRRLARAIRLENAFVAPGDRYDWAHLVAASDLFVVAPDDETDPQPIAWAMAGGLGIVAPARRSIAEYLADRSNALLCRDATPRLLAAALIRLIDDEPLRRRLGETARGQAYEVFGQRDCLDNHRRIYENLRAGRPPGDAVRDTAFVA